MRLLLDTHIFIWAAFGHRRLTDAARKLIRDADEVYVSAASIWEASIKLGLGKLDIDLTMLVAEISKSGYVGLPVSITHASRVRQLPDIHRDPFDRLLIAQALSEPLQFITADGRLGAYSEMVITV